MMEFWSVEYLATMAGAVAVTKVVTTILCNHLDIGFPPRWVALVVALLVQLFVWLATMPDGPIDWVTLALAVFNAALVYLGAVGTNAITASMVLASDPETTPETTSADLGRVGSARWF
jgi:hypothetical protein